MDSEPIRIILVGPPNSGKSVFSEGLYRALSEEGVNSTSIELDLWALTQPYLRGEITKEEREQSKRNDVSKKEVKDRARKFRDASKKYQVVLGDAPGMITEELKILAKPATFGIIVCGDKCKKQLKDWKNFLKANNIELIGIIISSLKGKESVKSNPILEATITGLEREKDHQISDGTRSFASILRAKLGI